MSSSRPPLHPLGVTQVADESVQSYGLIDTSHPPLSPLLPSLSHSTLLVRLPLPFPLSLSPTFDFLLNVSEHANSTCHLSFNYFSLHTANHTARSLAGHTETHTHSAATLADRLRTAK